MTAYDRAGGSARFSLINIALKIQIENLIMVASVLKKSVSLSQIDSFCYGWDQFFPKFCRAFILIKAYLIKLSQE